MEFEDFEICDRDLSDQMLTQYLSAAAIAVDTETMGLLMHRDRLCLVQLCDPQGKVTVVRIQQGQTSAPRFKSLDDRTHSRQSLPLCSV
ncbi:hypothetical protein [Neosynechococcus sphagnicola]|uniref:hypothetical protein n=1 Tax=Neosynechococcus sphagnicola TaxID=1501145 RepID=UPI000A654E16